MARIQLLLCFTILFASVTLMDVVSATIKIKPALPQIEDPKTVKDVEAYTVKVVMVFVSDLEKECPKTNKFKAFFEKLRAYAKYVCPLKRNDQKDYDRDMKAKAGSLFQAISSFAVGKIKEEIQEEKMEAINNLKWMKSLAGKILGSRKKEESEDSMQLTAQQQKEIKEGILKWETVITRITNTMVQSTTNSSSSEDSTSGKETQSGSSKSSGSSSSANSSGSGSAKSSGSGSSSFSSGASFKDTTGSSSNLGSPSGSPTTSPSGSTYAAAGGSGSSFRSTTGGSSLSPTGSPTTSSGSSKSSGSSSGKSSSFSSGTSFKDTTGSSSNLGSPTGSRTTSTSGSTYAAAGGSGTSFRDTTGGSSLSPTGSPKNSPSSRTSLTGTSAGSTSSASSASVSASQSSTVAEVEAETSTEVMTFILNLEKKCPQKEEYKSFFEKLKGTMTASAKVSSQKTKGFFFGIKSAAGKLSDAMAFMRSRIGSKSSEVKKSMEAYQGEVMKAMEELDAIHSKIISQNQGKKDGSVTVTATQRTEIKQTITKWEQVTTQFVETAIQSESSSNSSAGLDKMKLN